jgi:integrase
MGRPRDMKGLWKRGNVWWAVVPLPGGGRVRRSLETADLAVAVAEVRRLRGLALDGTLGQKADGIEAVVDAWAAGMRAKGISAAWSSQGAYVVKGALAAMEISSLAALTRSKVEAWLASEVKRTSPHTAATYLRRLDGFCRWLSSSGRAREVATEGVQPPPAPPRLRKLFLSREQARKLIDECEDEGLKFALYCALHAGLRRGEISAASPDWFDLEAGLLHVQNTSDFTIKDRDDRTIPLTAEFRAFLQEYGLRKPYMLEPKAKPGKARYRFDIEKRWRAHRRKCGLEDFTFHDLRRSFASLLASSGVSLYKIAKWLGDGMDVVERRYAHLIAQDDDVNRAWDR